MNFDKAFEDLAERVADLVVAKLQDSDGSSWPPAIQTTDVVADIEAKDLADVEPDDEDPEVIAETEDREPTFVEKRTELWEKQSDGAIIQALVDGEGDKLDKYVSLTRRELIPYIVNFETLIGKELELSSNTPRTPEHAVRYRLPELRKFLPEDTDTAGMDREAVVDILFKEDDPEELTEEEVREMDRTKLLEVANEFELKYDSDISREDLRDLVLTLFDE